MTEFGLIVGIDGLGLLLAVLMWRSVSAHDAGPLAIRRLGAALERAAAAFCLRQLRLIGAITFAMLVLSVAVSAGFGSATLGLTRFEIGLWTAAGLCVGACGGALSGYFSALLATRGSARTAVASSVGMDASLSLGMRAAGASALFAEATSGLGLAVLFGLFYSLKGGFALHGAPALSLAVQGLGLLPSFALGAAASALVVQRCGSAFHAASGVGSDQAAERDAGLDHDDSRNPAVVAELVGDHVGASAARNVEGFAMTGVANVAAMTVFGAIASATPLVDPLSLIALPLIMRAFALLSSAFGLWLVRSTEAGRLSSALLRGYASSAAIALAGIFGTSYWLLGEQFLREWASATLGVGSVLLAAHTLSWQLGRRSRALRDTTEALRIGGGATVASGLGAGFRAALLPLGIVAVAATATLCVAGDSGGSAICLLSFCLAALVLSPFVAAVATLGSVADGARGMLSMVHADAEPKRRSAKLDDASFGGSAVARQYARLSSALSSLLAVWAIEGQAHSTVVSAASAAALVWCGAIGAAVVLGYGGSVARAAVSGARDVAAEVERQLRGFSREHGVAQVPSDYTPSYRSCVDLTSAVSVREALWPMCAGLAAPVLLAIGLRVLGRASTSALVGPGLIWFVTGAALTGLCGALAAESMRAVLGGVRRAQRGRDSAHAFATSTSADAASDILSNAAAPALQLLVEATAAAALTVTPFLI